MITDLIGLHLISSIAIIYRLVLTGFIAYLSSTQALPQQGWCFHQCRYHRDKAQPQVADCLLAPVPLVLLQPLYFLGMLLPNQQLCAGPLKAVHENNTTFLLEPFTLDCSQLFFALSHNTLFPLVGRSIVWWHKEWLWSSLFSPWIECLFLLSKPKNVTLLESFCLEFHPVRGFMNA